METDRVLAVPCPRCGAEAGKDCVDAVTRKPFVYAPVIHKARTAAWFREQGEEK